MHFLNVCFDLRQRLLVGLVLVLKARIDLAEIDLAARLNAKFSEVAHIIPLF